VHLLHSKNIMRSMSRDACSARCSSTASSGTVIRRRALARHASQSREHLRAYTSHTQTTHLTSIGLRCANWTMRRVHEFMTASAACRTCSSACVVSRLTVLPAQLCVSLCGAAHQSVLP
jgi:hypothetical protein